MLARRNVGKREQEQEPHQQPEPKLAKLFTSTRRALMKAFLVSIRSPNPMKP